MINRRTLLQSAVATWTLIRGKTSKALTASHLVDDTNHSRLRIGFGSCCLQTEPQGFWSNIAEHQMDFWVWLGDAIYGDLYTMGQRIKTFEKIKSQVGYQKLKQKTQIIGTWDDHDYAHNGADSRYFDKVRSQKAFLDFLDEPVNSARRTQRGIYTAKRVTLSELSVTIILLDLRYFKTKPGQNGDLLGDAQWDWLTEVLKDAKINDGAVVLCSSIQLLPDSFEKDCWDQYPSSRARILNLIDDLDKPCIILSGDRHFVEHASKELPNGKRLFEFTSSGMTHTSDQENNNVYRIGPVVREKNFSVLEIKNNGDSLDVTVTAFDPSTSKVLLTYSHSFEVSNSKHVTDSLSSAPFLRDAE